MMSKSGLSVQLKGAGTPIVIVHGWMMAGFVENFDFEPIFETTEGCERHYLDLPGMGASSANEITDLDSIFDRLVDYIVDNILPSSFLLVGTSCGAYLARALTLKFSSKVLGLLLRVPLMQPLSSKRDIGQLDPLISDAALLNGIPPDVRHDFAHVPYQTEEYIAALNQKYRATGWPAIAAADAKVLQTIRNDATKYILSKPMHSPAAPFNAPTLLVLGRHDTDVGYRDGSSREILDSYPRATSVILDGATHALPVTNNEKLLFKALVLDWLNRVIEYQQHRVCKKA